MAIVDALALDYYGRTAGPQRRDATFESSPHTDRCTWSGLQADVAAGVSAIREGGRPPCAHVHQLLRAKAAELDRKLADLLSLRARIRRSLAAWKRARPTRAAVCPHIERGPQRVSGADAAGVAGRPPTGRGTPRRAR